MKTARKHFRSELAPARGAEWTVPFSRHAAHRLLAPLGRRLGQGATAGCGGGLTLASGTIHNSYFLHPRFRRLGPLRVKLKQHPPPGPYDGPAIEREW